VPEIHSIEVRALAPDVERFRYTSFEDEVYTTTTLVRVADDAGTVGMGAYDSDSYGDWDRAPLETLRTIVPRLEGADPDDHDAIQAVLTEDGTLPFPPAVRSAVDIACWDLAARRAGEPLHRWLGGDGTTTSMPSYASVPMFDDAGSYLDAIEGYVAYGYTAIKIHAWGDPSRDAELLRTVRARFDSLVLMHDAEGRYDRDGATLVARACADVGARWFEAPLPDFDLDGYRRLRVNVPDVPILAAGDAIWDARLMADLLRNPAWDAMRFDVSFVGGLTPTFALMSVAGDAGMPVELISYGHTVIQAANLHAALAFGRTSFFEQAVPPEPFEHGVVQPLRTGPDGLVEVSARPGLGIELDDAAIEDATLGVVRAGEEGCVP
jgi:L-alanine-DL-glutamate epimerase-like enolase superfamily enzyme